MRVESGVMTTIMTQRKTSKVRRTLTALLTTEQLDAFAASHQPLSQVDAVTAMVKWFTEQDEVVRKDILGLLPAEYRRDLARIVLERMANEPSGGPGRQGGAEDAA